MKEELYSLVRTANDSFYLVSHYNSAEQPLRHEGQIKKQKIADHVVNHTYVFCLCLISPNTLSSVVPILRRQNLCEINLKNLN